MDYTTRTLWRTCNIIILNATLFIYLPGSCQKYPLWIHRLPCSNPASSCVPPLLSPSFAKHWKQSTSFYWLLVSCSCPTRSISFTTSRTSSRSAPAVCWSVGPSCLCSRPLWHTGAKTIPRSCWRTVLWSSWHSCPNWPLSPSTSKKKIDTWTGTD